MGGRNPFDLGLSARAIPRQIRCQDVPVFREAGFGTSAAQGVGIPDPASKLCERTGSAPGDTAMQFSNYDTGDFFDEMLAKTARHAPPRALSRAISSRWRMGNC